MFRTSGHGYSVDTARLDVVLCCSFPHSPLCQRPYKMPCRVPQSEVRVAPPIDLESNYQIAGTEHRTATLTEQANERANERVDKNNASRTHIQSLNLVIYSDGGA